MACITYHSTVIDAFGVRMMALKLQSLHEYRFVRRPTLASHVQRPGAAAAVHSTLSV